MFRHVLRLVRLVCSRDLLGAVVASSHCHLASLVSVVTVLVVNGHASNFRLRHPLIATQSSLQTLSLVNIQWKFLAELLLDYLFDLLLMYSGVSFDATPIDSELCMNWLELSSCILSLLLQVLIKIHFGSAESV